MSMDSTLCISKNGIANLTNALEIKNVITTGRSFVLSTSAEECNAKATPCLPSQPASTLFSVKPASRIYRENKVERDSWVIRTQVSVFQGHV